MSGLSINPSAAASAVCVPSIDSVGRVLGSPVIDVRLYGAIGDGVADDTAAIQAAINACPSDGNVPSGGRVYLPPGIYKTTAPIQIFDSVHLVGASRELTIINATLSDTTRGALEITGGPTWIYGVWYTGIMDIRVHSNGYGIRAKVPAGMANPGTASLWVLDRLEITRVLIDSANTGLYLTDSSLSNVTVYAQDSRFRDILFNNVRGTAAYITGNLIEIDRLNSGSPDSSFVAPATGVYDFSGNHLYITNCDCEGTGFTGTAYYVHDGNGITWDNNWSEQTLPANNLLYCFKNLTEVRIDHLRDVKYNTGVMFDNVQCCEIASLNFEGILGAGFRLVDAIHSQRGSGAVFFNSCICTGDYNYNPAPGVYIRTFTDSRYPDYFANMQLQTILSQNIAPNCDGSRGTFGWSTWKNNGTCVASSVAKASGVGTRIQIVSNSGVTTSNTNGFRLSFQVPPAYVGQRVWVRAKVTGSGSTFSYVSCASAVRGGVNSSIAPNGEYAVWEIDPSFVTSDGTKYVEWGVVSLAGTPSDVTVYLEDISFAFGDSPQWVNPVTGFVQWVDGTQHLKGTAAPTTGTWNVGDTVINSAPAASGNWGWVCTSASTSPVDPGTWKTFGTISA